MAPEQVWRDCSIDRISNLPCSVIELILTYLPLRDAARTSALSRQWRHNWLTISDLVFDLNFIESLPENYEVEYVVCNILLRHKGPIFKFVFTSNKIIEPDAIDNWLQCLAEHHRLEHLTLELWNYSSPCYVVPQYLFSCQHLRELHLKNVEVQVPSSFNGFNRLVILNLEKARFADEVLKTFTSKCPILRSLFISSDAVMSLHISAPNLKYLSVWGPCTLSRCFQLAVLEKISMRYPKIEPSLRKEILDLIKQKGSLVRSSYVTEWFSRLPFIKEVEVDCWVIEFLALGDVPQKFPRSLHHLTHLKVNSMCLEFIEGISIVVCLIRSTPNLQSLHVSLDSYDGDKLASIQYLKAQQECSDPLSCSLKNVTIESFDVDECKMELVKLLLSRITALENLEIKSSLTTETDLQDMYKMVVKVASFTRASSKAVVVFD